MWLAWYGAGTGIHLRQIDPATGAPLAPSVSAPDSANICAGCRVVYRSADGQRVQSYASGEARPVVVGPAPPKGSLGALAAAYASSGQLWVAWQSISPVAVPTSLVLRGDATGAGGAPFAIGQPNGTISLYQLAL